MKMHLTTRWLFTVLGVCLLLAGVFCLQTYFLSADLREKSGEVTFANNRHALVQQLVNECGDYSKQHPAMTPILESLVGKRPAAK